MSKIAIIEDDKILAQMYQIKFESEGFSVGMTGNGKEGLELLEKMKPDLALVDLLMPEMTGEEMLLELRKTDWGKAIKVIVLTNISRDEATIDMKKLSIDEYVVKAHTTPGQVIDIVNKVLAS